MHNSDLLNAIKEAPFDIVLSDGRHFIETLKEPTMKSLLSFLLIAWYSDLRRNVPSNIASKVNAGIRGFANADPKVAELVEIAKKSGAAQARKYTRNQQRLNLAKTRRRGSHLQHIPCRKQGK